MNDNLRVSIIESMKRIYPNRLKNREFDQGTPHHLKLARSNSSICLGILYFFALIALILPGYTEVPSLSTEIEERPVIILGSGVAALTAATYLARAGIPPLILTGPTVGGTITQSHNVQNWPGEISISGLDLGEKVRKQAELNGALLRDESVVSVDFSKRPFLITTKKIFGSDAQLKQYQTDTCIIALGATPNLLNIPGENTYWSRGVYSCAVCDGALYKDKIVAVVGGGDAALIEAQYLVNIAQTVHLLVRKEEFKSVEKERMKEILSNPNIVVHFHTVVEEIQGDGQKMTHLLLRDLSTQKKEDFPIDALFLAIGAKPNTELFRNQLELDSQGYILLKKHQESSVEGVYAVGDVSDPEFKQAISAAGDAAKAALQAQKYLASHFKELKRDLVKAQKSPSRREVVEIRCKEQLEKMIKEAEGPIFIDFFATFCGPCRMFAPLYETWAKEYGDKITFVKVNAEHLPELFEAYGVLGIPTLIILDEKGNVIRRSVGVKEIGEVDKRLQKIKEKPFITSQDLR